ncbi:signal transduction histidine kinase [Hymenobacter sp. UYAg731]
MSDSSAHLRFAADILQRLGEELIPNPEQGLIELVKNSYDAESKECTVTLENVTEPGGTITISDKGNGMQKADLESGFLVIGRSRKDPKKPTPNLKRLPVGDKGLGRLAALRLGHKVTVKSRPKTHPGVEFTLVLDWDKIEASDYVEKVELIIKEGKTKVEPGVTIEIQKLRKALPEAAVTRLARELLLISDPFKSDTDFKVELKTVEFVELQKLVTKSYFEDAIYYLEARTDETGHGTANLIDSATGLVLATTTLPLLGKKDKEIKPYHMPSAELQLWMFKLGGGYTSNSADTQAVRKWISSFGGVYVYHRNLRVRPYGDPGSDWLDMNLSRVSHPEERPSTNNSIGRVTIEDPEQKLIQPTSRAGFVDTKVFEDLRRFGQDAIGWSSTFRLRIAEQQRELAKKNAPQAKKEAINELEESLDELYNTVQDNLPQQAATKVKAALRKVKIAQTQEVVALREDLQLYRSLATAGTTAVVFAHESAKPLTLIEMLTNGIEKKGRRLLGDKIYDSELLKPVSRIKDIFANLNVYSRFPLYHLKKAKRRVGPTNVGEVWKDMVELFLPILKQSEIEIKIDFEDSTVVRGSVASFEAIAANLISNSVYALTKAGSRLEERLITIKGSCSADKLHIIHADNGPGIKLPLDEIWLPGKTTNSQGTGFGLTIVRDSVNDLKGSVEAIASGKMKGAEFHFSFPLIKSS